jgi:adenylate cyclase
VVPAVETLQSYVWRRHTLGVASRLLLATERDGDDPEQIEEDEGVVMGVGFADIVNYTRQSRSLSRQELSRLIDHFESRALEILTAHEGRIVKTIGDEILFVADDPEAVARIGLELVEERLHDEGFPELRVGLAWGPTLARLGDVLGPVVNVASRLTSTSRPGRVLVDRALAEELKDNEHFKLRRLRRTSVRGYRNLEPWSLRRPADEDPEISDDGNLPGPASSFLHQQSKGLRQVVDELGAGRERSSDTEGPD